MGLHLSVFQVLGTCSAAADRPHCTKTPHLQVLNLILCGQQCCTLFFKTWWKFSTSCICCCLFQTTSHWSPGAAHPRRAPLLHPQWLAPLPPVQALPDCGAPSSAQLVSTSAAKSCGCFRRTQSPPSCPHPFLRHTSTWSRAPLFTVAAFHVTYPPSKAKMVHKSCRVALKCIFYDAWVSLHICLLSFMMLPLDGILKHSQILHKMLGRAYRF